MMRQLKTVVKNFNEIENNATLNNKNRYNDKKPKEYEVFIHDDKNIEYDNKTKKKLYGLIGKINKRNRVKSSPVQSSGRATCSPQEFSLTLTRKSNLQNN